MNDLSNAEKDVLKYIVAGYTNPEIAAARHVSINTVKRQVRSLLTKTNAKNRVQLAVWAVRR